MDDLPISDFGLRNSTHPPYDAVGPIRRNGGHLNCRNSDRGWIPGLLARHLSPQETKNHGVTEGTEGNTEEIQCVSVGAFRRETTTGNLAITQRALGKQLCETLCVSVPLWFRPP